MKKLILLNLMMLLLSWSINAQTAPAGEGTSDKPYEIATLENLYWISANPSVWGEYFIQTNDIDASATSTWNDGKGWSPIGNSSAPFVGTYDGMGHTIRNLYINQPGSDYSGLFGYTGSMSSHIPAKIQNLGVINVNINGGYFLGALVGHNQRGYISNCYSTGTVIGNNSFVGGLVGSSVFSSYITYCYSEANVTGATGDLYVGGLVGFILDSEISNSYSRGSVTAIFDPFRNTYCGGLVGVAKGNALIRNCYSTGLVSGTVGPSLTAHVYGGLIARSDVTVSVVNSFWDIITSGATNSAGGTGKTTAQMKYQFTYTGWDFKAIWGINSGINNGYPYLVTKSACVNGTLTLLLGLETQNVFTNENITPIVYYVGGGSSGVSISPALPTGLSGVYDAVNSKYIISGKCSSPVVYNYSVTTTGTKLPCKEAKTTGTITIIPQPECAGYAVGLLESYDDPDSYPEAFPQYPGLAVGSPDGRPADLNYPGEYLALDITGSPNLYRPAGSSVFLSYNVPLSSYPCNPVLNVQCSMNGTEWSVLSSYTFQMEGYYMTKEIVLTEDTRYLKFTLTNCFVSSGILIEAVTYDPDLIPCMCVSYPDPPIAANNGPVCEGETLSLTASNVSGATYSWTGPNGFASMEQNPTVSPAATVNMAGTYSVMVTVGECTSEPATTTVVVNPLPTAGLSCSDTDNTICAGDAVTFTASGGTFYEFFVDDISQGETSATNTFTTTLTNGQQVRVKVTNDNDCSATSNGITTTVNPLPTAGLSSSDTDNTICAGDKVTFTASGGTLYEFFVEDVSQGEAVATNTFTTTLTDGQKVTVEVTNDNGCFATSNAITTTVNPLPEVSSINNNNPVCYDEDAYFYLEGTPGAEVTYSFDGGTTTNTVTLVGGTATITDMEATSEVTLSLVCIKLNTTGCSKVLNETSIVKVYIPTANISGAHEGCISTILTAVSDASSPVYKWGRMEGDKLIQVGEGSTLEVTQSGNYLLGIEDGINGCWNISEVFTVIINPLPEVSISGNNNPVCIYDNATFNLEGTPGAVVTYSFNGGPNRTVTLKEGITPVTSDEAPVDITLSLISIKNISTGCINALNSTSTVTVNPYPNVSINGSHEDCVSTTLTAETDASNPVYAWYKVEGEEPPKVGEDITLEVTQSGNYGLVVTDESTGCTNFSVISVTINPFPEVSILSNTIFKGGTTTLNPTTGGTWTSSDEGVAAVIGDGIVKGIAEGIVTFTFTDEITGCSATTETVTVTGKPPVFTACPVDQPVNTDDGVCSAVVIYTAAAVGTPEPSITYGFTGATKGSGAGTGSGSSFNRGETTITITASNGILPDAVFSFKVTVTDNEAPIITCAEEINQTADQGMCSATVTVVPPMVTDNCDNNVLPVSSNELIKNGNFNAGVSNWQDCGNTAEVNTEEFYIVPLPPHSSNFVAEVDKGVSLCQEISGFTVGNKYVLTFKATRRQNTSTPNPVSANVMIDGGALSQVVTRANTTLELTAESFVFTATQETHKLTFTPSANNTSTLGFVVDDISIRSITYPVGTTTLVWTATDVYGNTATCEQDITVTDDEVPVITLGDDITQTADAGLCSAEVVVTAPMATDNCGIQGSVAGTRSDAPLTLADPFPVGTTSIKWEVSDVNGNPAAPVTQSVTVTDNEAPDITCAPEITQTADPGKCSAVVTVVPPMVTDNCDNHVLPISNTELIKNGNFNAGDSYWENCGNIAEINTEEYYIVPEPPHSSNFVAEVDKGVSLCQNISGFTVGHKYVLTFKASRRQNNDTPNPVSANVIIDGSALSKVVTRTNTTFDLTIESFEFTATKTTHKLTFTPYTNNTKTLGLIVDDISIKSITYPVGTTTLVWTATDVSGNTVTCEQKITVNDSEAPILTGTLPGGALDNLCKAAVPTAPDEATVAALYTDNCIGGISATLFSSSIEGSDCSWTATYTYSVKDAADNAADNAVVVYTGGDTEDPHLLNTQITSASLNSDNNNWCLSVADAFDANILETAVAALYTDNCGTITANYTGKTAGTSNSNCAWSFTYHFTIDDGCSNYVTCDVVYSGGDDTPPMALCRNIAVYLEPDGDVDITNGDINNGSYDNCGGEVTLGISRTHFSYSDLGTDCSKDYNVTLTVTDESTNQSECTSVVTVKKRPTKIVYSGSGLGQYSDPVNMSATLYDITPGNDETVLADKSVSFTIGSQSASDTYDGLGEGSDANGFAEASIVLDQSLQRLEVVSNFTGDNIYCGSTDSDPFIINCEDDVSLTTDNSETYFTANPTSGKGDVWFKAYIEETDGSPGNIANANIQFMNELSSPISAINTVPAVVTPIAGQTKAVSVYTLSDYQLNNTEMTTTGGHAWLVRAQTGNGSYYCGKDDDEPVVFVLAMPGGDFVTGGGKYIHTQSAGVYAATAGTWMNFGFNMKWNKSGKNLQGNINIVFRTGKAIYHIKSNAINALAVSQITQGGLTYNTGIMTTKANLTDITDPLNPLETPYGGNLNLKVVVWDATSVNGGTADKITVELTASDNTTLIYSSFASGITLADVIKGGNINVRNTSGIYVPPTCGAPTNVLAANLTQTSALITWDAVTYTSTCEVKYILSTSSAWSSGGTTTGNTIALSGLVAGSNYDVQVFRTCDGSTTPLQSAILTFTTTADNSSICTVTGLTALTDNTNKVTLSWSPVNTEVTSPPVSYKVEYKKSTATTWTAINSTIPNLVLTLATSTKYNWRVTPSCGTTSVNGPDFTTGATRIKAAEIATGIVPEIELADLKVYPNPFSEKLYFEFVSPVDDHVIIQIFDMTGRMVNTVFDNPVNAGIIYNTEFKPASLITGMYFYRMTMGENVFTGKVIYKK